MSARAECSTSWIRLVSSIGQDKSKFGNLILPYGLDVCDALKGQKMGDKKLDYSDVKKALDELIDEITKERQESNKLEKEKQSAEKNNKELKSKDEENKQKIENLESQNYQQGVGLGVGIPAAGAAGAGAVVGLPIMAKLLKNVFTRG